MKVWQQGAPSPGTIVGIRRTQISEDESTVEVEDYAVDVGGEVLGIRQKLEPRVEVRLGMPVTVHREGTAALIRWGAPIEGRWKSVKAPAVGIEDRVDSPPKGWTPVEAEILDHGSRSAMLGLTTVAQAALRVLGGGGAVETEALVDKFVPPFYASHLGAAGTRLPAHQHPRDPRKVRIDWPAAALATPGVGVEPRGGDKQFPAEAGTAMAADAGGGLTGFGKAGLLDRMQEKIQTSAGAAMGFDMNAGPADADPVPWDTFLAVSVAIKNEPSTPADDLAQRHGVAAGEWDAAHKRWMGRIMGDWKLGAAYGQALS